MAGLVWRVPLGQIGPLRPGAQDPQDAVHNLPAAAPRASASIQPPGHLADERLKDVPLLVCQIHGDHLPKEAVYHHL
jgi:hypothetical protein